MHTYWLAESAWDGAKGRLDQLVHGFFTSIPDLILAMVVFAGVLVVGRAGRKAVQRFAQERQKRKNVAIVLGRLTEGMIFILAILVAAAIVFPQFNAGSLISLLGIGSVAVGFAFREVLQNYLAGILLLLTEPFRIGDQVVFGPFEGIVEDIQTRATLLKTADGRRVVVPNAELFTTSLVVNTAFDLRRLEYDVQLTFGQDIATSRKVILEALEQNGDVLKSPHPEVLIWDVNGSAVVLRTRWWVNTPDSVDAAAARHAMIEPVTTALGRHGIEWSSPVQQVVLQAPQQPGKKKKDDDLF